jgi:hypothetical protein
VARTRTDTWLLLFASRLPWIDHHVITQRGKDGATVTALGILPDNGADAAPFFPLPDGFSLEPQPFSSAQIAELTALFSTADARQPGQPGSGQGSGSRTRAA